MRSQCEETFKGRTIRKVMGGGGGGLFPTCTIIFSKFLACVDYFKPNPPRSGSIYTIL